MPPFIVSASSLPVTVGPNEVTNWSRYNYEGYEGQASYPEYHSIMQTMESVGKRYGCGRAMWEYSASENRFGTPEALMLLPYWTNGCIDSMEGLLFESSDHDAVPLHQPGRAVRGAVRARGRAALRPARRDARGAAPPAAGREVLHGRDPRRSSSRPTPTRRCSSSPGRGPWTYDYSGASPTPRGTSTW